MFCSYRRIVRRQTRGCQIFLGTIYQNGKEYTKRPQNLPDCHNIYKITTKYTEWPFKGIQRHSKASRNRPKLVKNITSSGNPELDSELNKNMFLKKQKKSLIRFRVKAAGPTNSGFDARAGQSGNHGTSGSAG
jgi:IS30 family transposase